MVTKKLFLSHSPVTKKELSGRWYKSIKNQSSIGGKIEATAWGDTKDDAEIMAKRIVASYNHSEELQSITQEEIENRLMDIFSRVEVKKDIRQCTNYIMMMIKYRL